MPNKSKPAAYATRAAAAAVEDETFAWFVGIDWATENHQVCVLDPTGAVITERVVQHTGSGFAEFIAWLSARCDGHFERVAVGIETPRGALVDTLLERGAAVFSLNPKQTDRFRDRVAMSGAKDDRRDAWVIGGALRTDRGAFRRVALEDPELIELRELGRADEELGLELMRLTNQLREQVYRVAPEWLRLAPNAGEPWFWALLAVAPTPAAGARLRRRTVEKLLRQHRIRRWSVDDVLEVLGQPPVYVAPGTVDGVARRIRFLVPRLDLVHTQHKECTRAMEQLLDRLTDAGPPAGDENAGGPLRHAEPAMPSDVAIVRSVPGVGTTVAGALFAYAARQIAARDYQGLRTLGGSAPVTQRSGKSQRKTVMRRACQTRLRNALYWWALASLRSDTAAKAYYATLRARGHSHGRALRSLADRWLRILTAMLRSRTLYDPAQLGRVAAAPV